MCYYLGFQAHLHGDKFSYELARDLSRETAWEAVQRIRCGKGTSNLKYFVSGSGALCYTESF